jgi:FkbM family methyltransferase
MKEGKFVSILLRLFGFLPPQWIRRFSIWRGSHPWVRAATEWVPRLMRHREGRIQRGVGKGLRFNCGSSAAGFLLGTHDHEVQIALSRFLRPGMTVYDIGANVGFTAVIAARLVGPSGHVVCFEPLPDNARQIEENARLNDFKQIVVQQVAMGKENGEATFLLSVRPTWGRLQLGNGTPDQPSGKTVVPVRRLDDFNDGKLPPPAFIKMDIEGAEVDALNGASAVLAQHRPVLLIESHGTNAAMEAILVGQGYRTHVLGSPKTLIDSPWDAQVLAVPAERTDLDAVVRDMTDPAQLR